MFADVSSANVVGYLGRTRPCQYACYGSAFVKPGQIQFSLAELDITWKATLPTQKNQGASRRNFIQFFRTESALNLDASKAYYKCLADGNWYLKDTTQSSSTTGDVLVEDPSKITFDAGKGFLCNFSSSDAKITFNGEVITGGEAKKLSVVRPCQYFVAGNPSAQELTLADIDITWKATLPTQKNQGASRRNCIQFFKTESALNLDPARCYYKCLADSKWYQKDTTQQSSTSGDVEIDPTKVLISAGEGFLCNFSSSDATISMGTSL